ncbi:ABC transporter permease, partial [Microbacterium sp.]|uniref:ABC transporter permease n=1 Tax=Microbacterium sp. TaxID=51671 RepID=UPI003C774471
MLLLVWRGVRQHMIRFLLSALAVVLGVAFVTGTLALRTSLSSTFDDIAAGSYSADLYLRPAAAGAPPEAGGTAPASGILLADADTVRTVSGVAHVAPSLEGSGVLVGADGTPVVGVGAPTVILAATDDMAISKGCLPDSAGQIAVETSALRNAGLKVGDHTHLVLPGGVREVEVVGQYEYDAAAFGATIVVIDAQSALAAFAPDGGVPSLGIDVVDGADLDAVARSIAATVGGDVTAMTGDDAGDGYIADGTDARAIEVRTGSSLRESLLDRIDDVIGFVSVLLIAFGAIALLLGGFIISNTFSMSVRQRMREIGVLRALGASPHQVFWEVVGQAIVVGLVGSALGVAAGMGLVALVQGAFAAMGSEMSSASSLTPETVVIAMVTGVAVSAVAAAIPARRAASIPPVQAMVEVVRSESSTRVRGIVGAVVLLGGVGAALAGRAIGAGGELAL